MNDVSVFEVTSIDDFANLYDELVNDNSTYFYNIDFIYDSFKNGKMYSLKSNEVKDDNIFNKNNPYLVPCFCIINSDNECEILWVHTRTRFKGCGRLLVKSLCIKFAKRPIGNSITFWKKCSIDLI